MSRQKLIFSGRISGEYRKLLRICRRSNNKIDVREIKHAFILACEHSKNSKGHIEESALFYGLNVACYVAEYIELGTIPIVAAILYKFPEKKHISLSDLEKEVNKEVITIIQDLIRIQKFDSRNIEKDAENLKKLLLTSVSDLRVILIRIAEIRAILNYLDPGERSEEGNKIAREAMFLYAPIAHKLGLYTLKSEIEDLAFKNLQSETYHIIEQKIKETATGRNKLIKDFIAPISNHLNAQNLKYEIKSRTKSVYSIWNKMKKQGVEFEEVYDIFAIRIIIKSSLKEEKANCWKVFSIVTNLYQPSPERMRDWITVPKAGTGYESLHTTVLEPSGRWIEVQIRTERMDVIAEKGLAAHWKYKGYSKESDFDNWLSRMRAIIEMPDIEVPNFSQELYTKDIFVFTPKGELRKLTRGATVLDFAYDIHSAVGDTCAGAKVNGRIVPIRYLLNNGDRVEILTQKNQRPKLDWLDFVISSKAQTKIRHALNEEQIAQAEQGKEIFKRRLRNWKIPFNDILVNRVINHLNLKSSLDFYSAIAKEKIDLTALKTFISSEPKEETKKGTYVFPVSSLKNKLDSDTLIIDGKMKNVEYKLSPCCNPIFGDDIFGFVTVNDGIKIHRIDCKNAEKMMDNYGYRMVKAQWEGYESKSFFRAGIRLKGKDEIGIMSKITDAISKDLKVNIQSVTMDSKDGTFEGTIKLFVKDLQHLESLIYILLRIKGIDSVNRIDAM